ncbi:MAG: ribosome small subunit-dependent GTPase A [Cytophagales bacterium]|nr:ribosome small subunit-dependent GTPase A [Cytophagales bacterium]
MTAVVTKSVGSTYTLRTNEGEVYHAVLKGKFKLNDQKLTNPIAVGDRVHYEPESEGAVKMIITEICPRKNYLIRKSTHKTEHSHIIASNIDEVWLIISVLHPRTPLGFVDRFLVGCESYQIPTKIILNKIDLLTQSKYMDIWNEAEHIYSSIGYECVRISVHQEVNMSKMHDMMKGKNVLISGQSGVGKSSLINRLLPHISLKTAPISGYNNKGTHTTTFVEMYSVNNDTFITDMPGIKEFGLYDMNDEEISHYFPEMRRLVGQCKFNTCTHRNEPGCQVMAGVEAGTIAQSRYQNYLGMLLER